MGIDVDHLSYCQSSEISWKRFWSRIDRDILAGTFVMLLGALDDRFDLDSLTKFAGQALAAGILLLYGVQILWFASRWNNYSAFKYCAVLTVVFVMLVINAVNFIDGLDGLASGIVAVSAIAFFAFSYILAVNNGFSRAGAPSLVMAIVVGLCIGFLPHNYHPAKIFMGDSGAMFLGLLLSASAITLTGQIDVNAISNQNSRSTFVPLILPFTVLAIPLLDLGMAVVRRILAGRSPFTADREHLHHRLLRMGKSQREVAIIMYLWTAMFAFPTVAAAFAPLWEALLLGVIIGLISLYVMFRSRRNRLQALSEVPSDYYLRDGQENVTG